MPYPPLQPADVRQCRHLGRVPPLACDRQAQIRCTRTRGGHKACRRAKTCPLVEDHDCSRRCALQHLELLRHICPRQDEISGYDHIAFEVSRRTHSSGLLSIKGCACSRLICVDGSYCGNAERIGLRVDRFPVFTCGAYTGTVCADAQKTCPVAGNPGGWVGTRFAHYGDSRVPHRLSIYTDPSRAFSDNLLSRSMPCDHKHLDIRRSFQRPLWNPANRPRHRARGLSSHVWLYRLC